MGNKKLILSVIFSFGFGCLVTGQTIWNVIHYWSSWRAWPFVALGLLNVTTLVFMVRSHLRWFDSCMACEYSRGKLDAAVEILTRCEHE